MRAPDGGAVPAWQVSADVEALAWDPHHPTQFVVAAEDGVVAAYDARQVRPHVVCWVREGGCSGVGC
jgi:periodic tryptophan protein 1